MFKSVLAIILAVLFPSAFAVITVSSADETPAGSISAERQLILRDMRTAVAAMKVSEKTGDKLQLARVVAEPIIRYSDPQRLIVDGTIWVWTVDGLPVMTMKLERFSLPEPERRWLFNAGSCSRNLIAVQWPFDVEFESKKPGLTFQPLDAGPKLSESKSGRLLQLKQLSRKFSATMIGATGPDDKSEMRLLPTPLFRYSSKLGGITDGALFGLSGTGTNPDAIVAIQWQEDGNAGHWEFACMNTTDCGLQIRLDDADVWSQSSTAGKGPTVFDTWTWFFSGRIE
jgi:hypothetical protein